MREAELIRSPGTDEGTRGWFQADGRTWPTIELPWRDNQREISCIPEGEYDCFLVHSAKFGEVYHVLDVHERSGILIHSGNWAGDRALGYLCNSYGCILPGSEFGRLRGQKAVMSSSHAVWEIGAHFGGEPFRLTIQGGY